MTTVIQLNVDDPRVGKTVNGAPVWPKADCNGNPYRKQEATTRHLTDNVGNACFVVLPANADSDDLAIIVVSPVVETPAEPDVEPESPAPKSKK